MDLEIVLCNENLDPSRGYSGVDVIVKDRESGRTLGFLQGLSFDIDINDIVMTANMTMLLQGVHFRTHGYPADGVPTLVHFEDDPDQEEMIYIRVDCPSPKTETLPGPQYAKSYSIPSAVDIKLYDAETGDLLKNITRFSFGASIDDTEVMATAVATGKELMRQPPPDKGIAIYAIGSPDPIRWISTPACVES